MALTKSDTLKNMLRDAHVFGGFLVLAGVLHVEEGEVDVQPLGLFSEVDLFERSLGHVPSLGVVGFRNVKRHVLDPGNRTWLKIQG